MRSMGDEVMRRKIFFSLSPQPLISLSIFSRKKEVGQGTKPGIGGHLPGEKVVEDISKMRMFPKGMDALSPAL